MNETYEVRAATAEELNFQYQAVQAAAASALPAKAATQSIVHVSAEGLFSSSASNCRTAGHV